jgi:CDP-glucose 4,6-dehydratase
VTFDVFRGKRVYVTGHTGFKGAWLSAWLLELGAEVGGFAKDIPTTPSLFQALGLEGRMRHTLGDIRDLSRLRDDLEDFDPEVVIHLAAQALVRDSYRDPVGTFATNVLGTVHVLEACRGLPRLRALGQHHLRQVLRESRMVLRVPGERRDGRRGSLQCVQGSR